MHSAGSAGARVRPSPTAPHRCLEPPMFHLRAHEPAIMSRDQQPCRLQAHPPMLHACHRSHVPPRHLSASLPGFTHPAQQRGTQHGQGRMGSASLRTKRMSNATRAEGAHGAGCGYRRAIAQLVAARRATRVKQSAERPGGLLSRGTAAGGMRRQQGEKQREHMEAARPHVEPPARSAPWQQAHQHAWTHEQPKAAQQAGQPASQQGSREAGRTSSWWVAMVQSEVG